MVFLLTHIPILFGVAGSILIVVSMSAVTVTGYQYLRAMESTQARLRAEENSRHPQPRR